MYVRSCNDVSFCTLSCVVALRILFGLQINIEHSVLAALWTSKLLNEVVCYDRNNDL